MTIQTVKKPENIKQFFIDKGTFKTSDDSFSVIAASYVNLFSIYMANERISNKTGERTVFATLVKLAPSSPKSKKSELQFEIMREDEDPVEAKCPRQVLDLLTETSSENAKAWREACYSYSNKIRPKSGDFIKLSKPIKVNGKEEDVFKVCKNSGKKTFLYYSLHHCTMIEIKNIKELEYELFDTNPMSLFEKESEEEVVYD